MSWRQDIPTLHVRKMGGSYAQVAEKSAAALLECGVSILGDRRDGEILPRMFLAPLTFAAVGNVLRGSPDKIAAVVTEMKEDSGFFSRLEQALELGGEYAVLGFLRKEKMI